MKNIDRRTSSLLYLDKRNPYGIRRSNVSQKEHERYSTDKSSTKNKLLIASNFNRESKIQSQSRGKKNRKLLSRHPLPIINKNNNT